MTETVYGTGRRKTAIARVYMREGSGGIVVNGKGLDDYFGNEVLKMIIRHPLEVVEKQEAYEFKVTVRGGGAAGQAGAIRHGVSRALLAAHPEAREALKSAGFLTRDSRKKERK